MSAPVIAGIVAAAVIFVAVVVLLVMMTRRTRRMRERFGPEYDRTVGHAGSRHAAERELAEREARHDALQLRPLSTAARERYQTTWDTVQAQFVDAPGAAASEAHRLVTQLMRDRGYPTEDVEDRAALLSVEHADVIDNYRAATRIEHVNRDGQASTEQLRQAMVHFRTLFDRLLTPGTDDQGSAAEPYPGRTDEVGHPLREPR